MAKCGLVLSGGGARGAYEAGILYYLLVDGPSELREKVHFDVLSGTSIGALVRWQSITSWLILWPSLNADLASLDTPSIPAIY